MNQVLSQNEVDALLAAVSDGDASGGDGNNGGQSAGINNDPGVIVYDLTSQDRIIRGRMPQLDVIYEKFMRAFRVSLSSALRKIASLNHASTDFLKFGEFINTLPIPTCMSVLRFNALRGSALIVVESKLAYALVDSFLGGIDRPYTKIEGKEFTAIELSIIRKVVELALADLETAWAPVSKIDASFVRTEVNPQFVGIVPPTDVVIASTFDIELENANGTVTLVIPYSTIEPIKAKLSSGFQVESDQTDKKLWTAVLKEQFLETDVALTVSLGTTEITMGELVNMQVGDIIPLEQDATGELNLQVEGVKKFKCYYGVSHGNVAVQVTRVLKDRSRSKKGRTMADKSSTATPLEALAAVQEIPPPTDLSATAEQPKADNAKDRNLDLIMDIPLKVTVELGRTKMVVHDLLALGQGSVIELSKLAGEPMEVLVNDKLVARGEAVVVNEKFGVRLTDIISPTERIQQLK